MCELNGDEYCQYEVLWTNRRNIFISLWEKTIGYRRIIEEQRLALEQSQEKLLERFEELRTASTDCDVLRSGWIDQPVRPARSRRPSRGRALLFPACSSGEQEH